MTSTSPTGATVRLAELCQILGDGPKTGHLARAVAAGTLKPDKQGRVAITVAVPMFFEALRQEAAAGTATAAAEAARAARADAQELRLAEARRELIPVEDGEAALDHVVGAILTSLSAMPARITRDVPLRRRVEAALHQAQAALARDLQVL
ncbi:hypothetical protein [Tabrizicola aquatica]|uniref:hypothetical protein n=1 Tax=Tabrizicola aquatica TaxID=909926 RepID=UPI000CD04083|nr:hypothetical protein [Tabrizicola aquatica]